MGDGKHRQLPLVHGASLGSAEAGSGASPGSAEAVSGGRPGKAYWKSLAELAGAEPRVAEEFAELAEGGEIPPSFDRRGWLKLMGAGLALAGLGGCNRKRGEKILPFVRSPGAVVPGVPRHYATSLALDGFATGVVVESYDGRPTKIEGNPDHPASLGATSAQDQAAVLGLYDPDRARAQRAVAGAATWERFRSSFGVARADGGAGLRFLLAPTGSPLAGDVVDRIRARYPAARFTFHTTSGGESGLAGGIAAFGAKVQPVHDFTRASVVVSLGDDFLASGPFSLRYARQWAQRRRPASPGADMSRLYVVETMPTPTGTMADHRVRRKPSAIAPTSVRLVAEVAAGPAGKRLPTSVAAALGRMRSGEDDPVIRAMAGDLGRAAGAAVVTVGPEQPPAVHALGHLLNSMVASPESTWALAPTRVDAGDAQQDLPALLAEIDKGAVDTLVILGENVVYTAPADLEVARRLGRVKQVVYLGLYEDETAELATWFVNAAHPLESWGDERAYDGTASIVQPLIAPMYGGRTAAEVLAVFAGDPDPEARRMVRERWARHFFGNDPDTRWAEALRAGLVAGTAAAHLPPMPLAERSLAAVLSAVRPAPEGLELAFAPDPSVYDGRFANNAWLLELPKPVTHLTWDNAAQVSPRTAARLGLDTEDVVVLDVGGRTVRAPVLVVPGHADDAVTVHLGWARRGAESIAHGLGFDAGALRTSATLWSAGGLAVHKVRGERYPLARTQEHFDTGDRPIALSATLAEYRKDPDFTAEHRGPVPTMLPPVDMSGDQWAMTIDTSICTGCSACVVACQAENNILSVGKRQVILSREMHWLRIDTYHHGAADDPRTVHEPMLCQHCERAPCEYVCPVNATVHSPDGLNEMVYNRCVGTRFCSNNCPYKVRRFNWFDWNERGPQNGGTVQLQRNPDVTVRQRGVMEKCTYCVQRIREAEIHARVEGREIHAGEVVTACQQACPTRAIQFGSLRHPETEVVRWREEARRFDVLHDLGTSPRTAYLARIDNPNPEIG